MLACFFVWKGGLILGDRIGLVPFKEKLRGFQKAAIFIGLSSFLVLTAFIFLVQFSQLVEGRRTIVTYFEGINLKSDQIFEHLERRGIEKFLAGRLEEREMFRQIYQETGKLPFRSALSIYQPNGDLLLSTKLPNRDGLSDDSYVKIALKNIKEASEYRISKDYQGNRYLLKIKPILKNKRAIGYLVLYLDGNDFGSGLKSDSTQYMITDTYQNLFSSNSVSTSSQVLQKIDDSQLLAFITIRDGKLYLNNHLNLSDHLILYSYISVVPLSYLIGFTCLFALVIMLILMILARRLSNRIALHSSDSVDLLVLELNRIVNGYKTTVDVTTDDEFGYLARKINSVLDTLHRLFNQTLKSEKEKLVFQRKLLEAQFNPHFLYNSLESIKILIDIDPQKAQQMILALNRVLRYSIASNCDDVALADDCDIIEDYLTVNQIRFNELDVHLNYAKDLEHLIIPKLFLLPLIENALKYGLQNRHDLRLSIRVWSDDLAIYFSIFDNGPGFSETFRQQFSNYIKEGGTEHGLVNSYSRLAMLYPSAKIRLCHRDHMQGVELQFERKQACYV